MNIIIAGDTHAEWGALNQFISKKRPEIILQCGDFGWWPSLETKRKKSLGLYTPAWKLKGVKCNGTKVYWCDGNHEDHTALRKEMPCDCFRTPILLYDEVYYCPRGSILKLPDGRVVMFIGGADSIDKHDRIIGQDWFREELISYKEQNFILDYKGRVDIIVSHTCPLEFEPFEDVFGKREDPTRKILTAVLEKFKPELWFFGHWHWYNSGKHKDTRWFSLGCLPTSHSHGRWWIEY